MSAWNTSSPRFQGPPPWWPDDEPWPPRGRTAHVARRRARFVRRSGWYSFWPVWILFWILLTTIRGRGGLPLSSGFVLIIAGAVAAGTVAVIIRRIAGPVADIVAAADRIAHRDYRVRIDEPRFGPTWVGNTARAFNAMAHELDVQDQARRHLMADVAHELRTPLAVLQGKLEGLIDGVYPRDTEQLQSVLDDARLLARIVEDLRVLSTSESGALALAKEPTDVVGLANDVVSALTARAAEAGVTLGLHAQSPDDIEPIVIDPLRIREVLTNLVVNAVRYTPSGGRVEVQVGSEADHVTIKVIDTGTGISPADLPHIFDRFYKGAGSSGSGLGLTIARNLVQAHGGTLYTESSVGAGTTMVFSLPRSSG
jgi:two-component system OmpR family sensor kinase/two-component system sensor histidine kinase BaeS